MHTFTLLSTSTIFIVVMLCVSWCFCCEQRKHNAIPFLRISGSCLPLQHIKKLNLCGLNFSDLFSYCNLFIFWRQISFFMSLKCFLKNSFIFRFLAISPQNFFVIAPKFYRSLILTDWQAPLTEFSCLPLIKLLASPIKKTINVKPAFKK